MTDGRLDQTVVTSNGLDVLVIAEVGSVHDGSFGNAQRLIDLAADCGARVVKFQTHIAAAETLPDAPSPPYFAAEPRYEYFERTAFSIHQWRALRAHAAARGIEFLSSPFSVEAVELLEDLGVTRYKIPSGEVTNLPLLEAVAETGKDILISSGMSSWTELDTAVETILRTNPRLTVMQCSSEYPCPYERVGLNVMIEMRKRYDLPVGLSDHTLDNYAAFAAVALGAVVIEKHLTFSRRMYGSDASHSLEPHEFTDAVRGIRAIRAILSSPVDKGDVRRYDTMKRTFEKSIVTARAIVRGTVIGTKDVCLRKPGTGLPAKDLEEILGRRALRDLPQGTLLARTDVD